MLKWVLVSLGVITSAVMTIPQLVIVGFILLIIPGLILTLIPTVFVYLLATWLIRFALQRPPTLVTTYASFLMAVLLGIAVMQPSRRYEQSRFKQASMVEVTPVQKIMLNGSVLLDWPQMHSSRSDDSQTDTACDFLCAALLDTPGVSTVVRRTERGAFAFRRGTGHAGELVMPKDPEKILDVFNQVSEQRRAPHFDFRRNLERAHQATWALRIADGEEIRCESLSEIPDVDWTIHLVKISVPGQPKVDRLEIRNKTEQVVACKSLVQHFIPASFLRFDFDSGDWTNSFARARFLLGGASVSNQPRFYHFDPNVELIRMIQTIEPQPSIQRIAECEAKLREALDNPLATEAELLLAPMWLSQFRYDAKAKDLDLMARILMDDRIFDPQPLLNKALSSKLDLSELRTGIAKRYLGATDSKAKSWYIRTLTEMPPGTFLIPTSEERNIWDRALTETEAAPFIERLADQGEAGVPIAMSLLEAVLTKPWHARRRVLDGVRGSLTRAGPKADVAIPRIRALLTLPRSPLLNAGNHREEWLVALYRMGVVLDDLPYGNGPLSPAQVEAASKRIQHQVHRYESQFAAGQSK